MTPLEGPFLDFEAGKTEAVAGARRASLFKFAGAAAGWITKAAFLKERKPFPGNTVPPIRGKGTGENGGTLETSERERNCR